MDSFEWEVSVIRSKRKSISIEIKSGAVLVRAPKWMKDKDIKKFLLLKKSWIEKHLELNKERQEKIKDLKPFTDEELKELTEQAKKVIPERVDFYADKIGVKYNRITIRHQKTRWGSCSSQGNLNFNCLLMLFPLEVIDSVVLHELCHRKHMNHSSAFYNEIDKVFPEYKKYHKYLSENGAGFLARLK